MGEIPRIVAMILVWLWMMMTLGLITAMAVQAVDAPRIVTPLLGLIAGPVCMELIRHFAKS